MILPPALLALGLFTAPAARATGKDFLDETLVARGLEAHEFGVEIRGESRIDNNYRLQGWFGGELEAGLTRRLGLEAGLTELNRGQGLEFAGWKAEGRYLLLDSTSSPVDVALATEYELEGQSAKHLFNEKIFHARGVFTRQFTPKFLGTVNLGLAHRFAAGGTASRQSLDYGFGARYPEGGACMAGLELSREPLDKVTRITPQLWIQPGGEFMVRMGASWNSNIFPYRLICRAVVETEF
jgi:hypothetical protein